MLFSFIRSFSIDNMEFCVFHTQWAACFCCHNFGPHKTNSFFEMKWKNQFLLSWEGALNGLKERVKNRIYAKNNENLLAHKISESILMSYLMHASQKKWSIKGGDVIRMDLKPFQCNFIWRKHSIWLNR